MSTAAVRLAARTSARTIAVTSLLAEGPALLGLVPLWAWWAVWRGGEPVTVWAPGLAYLAVVIVLLARVERPALSGTRAVAVGALLALGAWSTLSIAWAADQGAAVTAAGRLWVVVLAGTVVLVWTPTLRALALATGLFIAAAAAAAAVSIVSAINAPGTLIDGRVIGSTGYVNATAALLVMAAISAMVLAARQPAPVVTRSLALAAAGGLGSAALLQQSRGALLAAVGGGVITLLLAPQRLRLIAVAVVVTVGCVVVAPTMLDVRHGFFAHEQGDALRVAGLTLAGLVAVLAVVGALVGGATLPSRARYPSLARIGRVVVILAAVASVAGGVIAVASEGGPAAVVKRQIDELRTPAYGRIEQADNRFTGGLGSNRVDYWRVAADLALDHPLNGTGAGNFAAPYLEHRHTTQAPLHAHDVWLATAAGTGFPGLALLLLAVGAVAVGAVSACRSSAPAARAIRVAAMVPAAVLIVHASADWSTVFPALTVPAVSLAAGAAAPQAARTHRGGVRVWMLAAAAIVLVLAVAPTYLGARLSDRAAATWPHRPAGALDDLRRAASIDRVSARPMLLEGVIALELGKRSRALAAFARASRRNEAAWYPLFMSGLLEAPRHPAVALRLLSEAQRRNPADELVRVARRTVARGGRVDPLAAQHRELVPAG